MIFNSLDFLIFFLFVFTVYWLLDRRFQVLFLLVASYFFYGYVHVWFLYLIFASTVVDYSCGLAIHRFPEKKKFVLLLSIFVNLGFLGFFKYFGFFVDNVTQLLTQIGLPSFSNHLDIFLPVGISFYTFQSMSYIIDVFVGRLKPRKNFFDFALFVSFFPQLQAGPIERASNFLPQVEKKRSLTVHDVREAIFLLVWGFFKKLVIADNVAFIVNKLFILEDTSFYFVWVGAFAFWVQVYADFSAYSDIARGTARLLGFKLSRNFNHPFISTSPTEFWKRWHISLSSYIKDYIFLPLCFSSRWRGTRHGIVISLLITFVIVGLWHGAGWNYVVFGLYHGLLVAFYGWMKAIVPARFQAIRWLEPFHFLLMFALSIIGFMMFRETDLSYILRNFTLSPFDSTSLQIQAAMFLLAQTVVLSLPLWIHILYDHFRGRLLQIKSQEITTLLHSAVFMVLFVMILIFRGDSESFIYFQF